MTITAHASRSGTDGITTPRSWLDRSEAAARLFVDADPFLIRGVELHNSSATSEKALVRALDIAVSVNANTVFAAVDWATVEPSCDEFDMSSVQRILDEARSRQLHVVLLWFGAWKNASSSYAPGWAKRDQVNFERCVLDDGTAAESFTPFGQSRLDEAAFVAFARYVEDTDRQYGTVLAIQIENEIGLLGASRDRSVSGLAAWDMPVPEAVVGALGLHGAEAAAARRPGGWSSLPGSDDDRDEQFMASGYATHVERLALGARAHTSIPFYVNAWLDSDIDIDIPGFSVAGGQRPGMYPSGGPLPRVAPLWRALAPTVDLFAPDYYFGDLSEVMGRFQEFSGGVLVPEMRRDELAASQIFELVGTWNAVGTSPFGIDSADFAEVERLRDAYGLLSHAEHLFHDVDRRSHPRAGFALTDATPTMTVDLGGVRLRISRLQGIGIPSNGRVGYGLVVNEGPGTFLFVGRGFRVELESLDPDVLVGIDRVQEIGGDERLLNGDETAGGTAVLHADPVIVENSPFPIASQKRHSGISRLHTYTSSRKNIR